VSLKYYKEKGYEPEAIINFMALIGWNPGTDQEIFSLEELIKVFDLSKVQKKGGIFNVEKLNWINKEHVNRQSKELQIEKLKQEVEKTKFKDSEKWRDEKFTEKFLKVILDRIHRWGEVSEILEASEFDYFFERPELDQSLIHWKKSSPEVAKKNLEKVLEILESDEMNYESRIMNYAEEAGRGEVLWPLRYSLSGKEKSTDPYTLLKILELEESKERINAAIDLISNYSN
jgi:glutamyl-tRNA synthetase